MSTTSKGTTTSTFRSKDKTWRTEQNRKARERKMKRQMMVLFEWLSSGRGW